MNREPTRSSSRRRGVAVAGTVICGALLLSACAGEPPSSPSAEPVVGGTLTIATGENTACIDPYQTVVLDSRTVASAVADSLVYSQPGSLDLEPWLATAWEVNDDATEFTITLREDVTFSDGTPLNADVVKANLDYVKSLGAKAIRGNGYLANYTGTDVIDDTTAKVSFSSPTAYFMQAMSSPTFAMFGKATTDATPDERCLGKLVGTGAFTLEDFTVNEGFTLAKREGYTTAPGNNPREGDAYVDEVVFKNVPEAGVRVGLVTSGQADVALGLATQDAKVVSDAGLTVLTGVSPGIPLGMFVNPLVPALSDQKVRQAIQVAVNREEIVEGLLGPESSVATSVLTAGFPGQVDLSAELAYDPERAASLLDDAGWVEGSDGMRTKDGEPLSVIINYVSTYGPEYEPLVQLVASQLKKVGIDAVLENMAPADGPGRLIGGDFQLYVTSIAGESAADLPRLLGYTLEPETLESSGLAASIAEAARSVSDDGGALADVQTTVIDQGFMIPIADTVHIAGVAKNVTGLRFRDKAGLELFNAQLTSVEP